MGRLIFGTIIESGKWEKDESRGVNEWKPDRIYRFESCLFSYEDEYSQILKDVKKLGQTLLKSDALEHMDWQERLSQIYHQYEVSKEIWGKTNPRTQFELASELVKRIDGLNDIVSLAESKLLKNGQIIIPKNGDPHAKDKRLLSEEFGHMILCNALRAKHRRDTRKIEQSIIEFVDTKKAIFKVLDELIEYQKKGRPTIEIPLAALVQEVVRLTEYLIGRSIARHAKQVLGKQKGPREFEKAEPQFVYEICKLVQPKAQIEQVSTVLRFMPKYAPTQK